MKTTNLKNSHELGYATKEAMNTLFTNISFAGENISKVLITSVHPNDGKSFVAFNLARTIAEMGNRVCLVDLDLRKSMFARTYMDIQDSNILGSSHYLAGHAKLDDVFYQTNLSNFYAVPCTQLVSSSLALFNSPRLPKLLDTLSENLDFVIVDSPPVGLLIDAAKVATSCDGTLVVVDYNDTTYRELIEARNQLEQSGSPILGTVINKATFDDYVSRKYYGHKYGYGYGHGYGYGYGYGYYYGDDEDEQGGKSKKRRRSRKK